MVDRYDIERYYRDSHPLVKWVERMRMRALASLAKAGPGMKVLEVGCGAGHVLERFEGTERTGLDLSRSMLSKSKKRLGPSVPLVQASADQLPFEDATFQRVVCTELLEHTPDPGAVLGELLRVAGPDGRVVVSIPNERNIDRVKRLASRVPGLSFLLRNLAAEANEWHLHRMDLRMLRKLVQDRAQVDSLRRIPLALLPLRYVAVIVQADPAAPR
jgi:SAM-dependent methyltransferase